MSNHSVSQNPSPQLQRESASAIPIWQIAALGGVILALYLPILIDLVADWYNDPNYSHGFLIMPLSALLIWNKREILKTIPLETGKWGLPIIIGSLIIFIIGAAGAEFFSTRVSLVGLLFGITLYLTGARFIKEIWFAFFFLLFMIPAPYVIYYSLTFPLQVFGTKVAAVIMGIIGIPHLRQGNIIHLPDNYSLEVAEACSGLRSLVTLLALAALLAYWTQSSKVKSVILFFSAIPIAIAANIFRINLTAIGAYAISRKIAEDLIHEFSGTIVFMFSLICLLILSSLLRVGEKK